MKEPSPEEIWKATKQISKLLLQDGRKTKKSKNKTGPTLSESLLTRRLEQPRFTLTQIQKQVGGTSTENLNFPISHDLLLGMKKEVVDHCEEDIIVTNDLDDISNMANKIVDEYTINNEENIGAFEQ